MSLTIGQNPGYISTIECRKSLPSMSVFFYIWEYLNVAPSDFFDENNSNPEKLQSLIENLKELDDSEIDSIATLVKGILHRPK